MGLVSARNYVLSNAVETVLSAARKPPPPPPPATAKPDYGRVPSYLAGHKARLAADKAAVEAAAREAEAVAEAASGVRLLGDDERLELLAALQAKARGRAGPQAGPCAHRASVMRSLMRAFPPSPHPTVGQSEPRLLLSPPGVRHGPGEAAQGGARG